VNDQWIKELEQKKDYVVCNQEEEKKNIERHFKDIVSRLEKARDSSISKLEKEVSKRLEEIDINVQAINSACLALSPELSTIQESMNDQKKTVDITGCQERVTVLLEKHPILKNSEEKFPHFFPSPTFKRVKNADFGFLQLAEFLPEDFILSLTSSESSLVPGTLVNCSVATSTGQFTSKVQANIMFTIKQEGKKGTVPFCKEECKVAEDLKSFDIVFPTASPGVFSVTVLLYGQHVQQSPLAVHVQCSVKDTQMKAKAASSTPPKSAHTSTSTPSSMLTMNLPKPRRPNIVSQLNLDQHLQPDFTFLARGGNVLQNVTMRIPSASQTMCGNATLTCPIGLCILNNKNIAVASTFTDQVKIFSNSGTFIKIVTPDVPFNHPSDMLTLRSGEFAVRDDANIQFFTMKGKYVRSLDTTYINKCYGMAEIEEGLIVTINENKGRAWRKGKVPDQNKLEEGTGMGETDLLFFNVETGQLVKRMEMAGIILDKQRSKCRFLTTWQEKLLITDLGMDCIYTLDLATKGVAVCGKSGRGPGCFSDPAGLVVDRQGNWLVADSRNHRLCVYTGQGEWVGEVRLKPGAKRPSALAMDRDTGDVYLLNLQGKWALVRYSTDYK